MENIDELTITILKNIILPILLAITVSVLATRRSVFQARIDLQKDYDNRFNTKRWETYLSMIEIIREISSKEQLYGDDSINLKNKIELLNTQILLIGSHKVIDAFILWQNHRANYGDSDQNTLGKLHTLVVEMRKDLGLKDNQPELEVMRGFFLQRRSR